MISTGSANNGVKSLGGTASTLGLGATFTLVES